MRYNKNKGFSIIEILMAIGVISIAFISFLGIVVFSLKSASLARQVNQADALAQEALEAVRTFRDSQNWSAGLGALTTGVAYHPALITTDTPSWSMVLNPETLGNFIRSVIFEKVSRDPASGHIEAVYDSNHDDSDTRRAVARVSFGSRNVELATYFTNWQKK